MTGIFSMKMMSRVFLLVLGMSGAASAADLLDTYHAAQANDPLFAAARATQQAGQEKLPQGRALLMPSVNLTANSTYNDLTTQYGKCFLSLVRPATSAITAMATA